MSQVDNRRIAKNTIFLYVRMLLIMGVTLYTSRVILHTLGIDDYGIYNLIAGFVTLFSFISNALVNAMQRYFNVAIGQEDTEAYKRYYSMSFNILFAFSLIIVLLGETIGLWFVQNKLNIPIERENAAFWTYQLALLTFVLSVLRTPFNASIIAYERMSFYAYISIGEVLLRLAVVFLLSFILLDKLILYSALYLVLVLFITLLYYHYCKKNFKTCTYYRFWDKKLLRELLSFSGWSLMGQSAVVITNQGQSIFINQFFSVAANAAMGVAGQLTSAIDQFVVNFQTAFNPQIIKTYAVKDYGNHYMLLFRASKFSYYLLLLLMLPICFNVDLLLGFWLTEIPEYTDRFCISILISYMFAAYSCPFTTCIFATGKIKNYEICHTLIFIITLVASYIFLYLGYKPYMIADLGILTQVLMLVLRLYCAKKEAGVSISNYVRVVLMPTLSVTVVSFVVAYLSHYFSSGVFGAFLSMTCTIAFITVAIILIGIDKNERNYLLNFIKNKV